MKPAVSMSLLSLLVGCAFATLSSVSHAQSLTPMKLRLAWTPSAQQTGVFLAWKRGYFREAGLDLQVDDGTGSGVAVQLVGAGQYDLGEAASSSIVLGRDRGLDIRSIYTIFRATDSGLIVPKGAGTTAKDLEGKKILYTAASVEGPIMAPFLKAGGADPGKVELVNVDFNSKVPAYVAGQGDAVATTVPFALPFVNRKRPSDFIMFSKYGFVLPGAGFFATEKTLRERATQVKAFVRVMNRVWTEIKEQNLFAEAAAAAVEIRRDQKLDAEEIRLQLESYRNYFDSDAAKGKPQGWQPPEDWNATVDTLRTIGLLKGQGKAQDFYTNDFFSH